jgi:acyl carrier protein
MNTSENLIIEQLIHIFRDVFDDEDLVIGAPTSAEDVDGWDSLANIRLMISIEKVLGIQFSAAEISGLNNVGEMARLILKKQAGI